MVFLCFLLFWIRNSCSLNIFLLSRLPKTLFMKHWIRTLFLIYSKRSVFFRTPCIAHMTLINLVNPAFSSFTNYVTVLFFKNLANQIAYVFCTNDTILFHIYYWRDKLNQVACKYWSRKHLKCSAAKEKFLCTVYDFYRYILYISFQQEILRVWVTDFYLEFS